MQNSDGIQTFPKKKHGRLEKEQGTSNTPPHRLMPNSAPGMADNQTVLSRRTTISTISSVTSASDNSSIATEEHPPLAPREKIQIRPGDPDGSPTDSPSDSTPPGTDNESSSSSSDESLSTGSHDLRAVGAQFKENLTSDRKAVGEELRDEAYRPSVAERKRVLRERVDDRNALATASNRPKQKPIVIDSSTTCTEDDYNSIQQVWAKIRARQQRWAELRARQQVQNNGKRDIKMFLMGVCFCLATQVAVVSYFLFFRKMCQPA